MKPYDKERRILHSERSKVLEVAFQYVEQYQNTTVMNMVFMSDWFKIASSPKFKSL